MYVCGYDHFEKCGLDDGMPPHGVIALPRDGHAAMANPAAHVFAVPPELCAPDIQGVSSTKLREALSQSLPIGAFLPPGVDHDRLFRLDVEAEAAL